MPSNDREKTGFTAWDSTAAVVSKLQNQELRQKKNGFNYYTSVEEKRILKDGSLMRSGDDTAKFSFERKGPLTNFRLQALLTNGRERVFVTIFTRKRTSEYFSKGAFLVNLD